MDISCIPLLPARRWIQKSLRETPQAFHTEDGFRITSWELLQEQEQL